MSLKRKHTKEDLDDEPAKMEAVTESSDEDVDDEESEIDGDYADSNFFDDDDEFIEDDFNKLNLDEDSDDDSLSEASDDEDGSEDEWEDIDENEETQSENEDENSTEKDQEMVENESQVDSDYVGSSHEDSENDLPKEKKESSITKNKKTIKRKINPEIPVKYVTTEDQSSSSIKTVEPTKKKKDLSKAEQNQSQPSTSGRKKGGAKTFVKKDSSVSDKKDLTESSQTDTTHNEYEEDSSDEEDLRNTIGNIPINWYEDYDHVGYNLDGLPIPKPKAGDTLDQLLDKMENPDHGRLVFDKQTGQNVRLSDAQLDLIQRIMDHRVPNPDHDMYAPFVDIYSHEVMKMPLSGRAKSKKSFLPSKAERRKVSRVACLIKRGLYDKSFKHKREELARRKEKRYYDLWKPRSPDDPPLQGVRKHIPAPKMALPGHELSYNPPIEYKLSKTKLESLTGKKRQSYFKHLQTKTRSVRGIPFYHWTVTERYNRLMDLYLKPRKKFLKVNAKPDDIMPTLPDKKDLRPYPRLEGHTFVGHRSIIRSISVHPAGKYLASGSDDRTVRIWEISTGRCLRTFEVEEAVKKVSWNPNPKLFLLGVAMGTMVVLMCPETYLTDKIVVQQTNSLFREEVDQGEYTVPEKVTDAVTWRRPTEGEWAKGYRVVLDHFKEVRQIAWHRQGDYFATVLPDGISRCVIMHQLSRWRSQLPFRRNKGRVEAVAFHPKHPEMFVVTQRHIRVYNLKSQRLTKKIQANSRWVSSIAVHPGGEHFIVGCYDRKVNWFEIECTKRPHMLRYHTNAVRSVSFHRKYPLFASCSDDHKVMVSHGTVYDDLVKDPLIVPLKELKGSHKKFDDLFVLDVAWHPFEPFLFTAGADAKITLFH